MKKENNNRKKLKKKKSKEDQRLLTYRRMLKSVWHEKNKQDIEKTKTKHGRPLFRSIHIEIFVGEFEDGRDEEEVDDDRTEKNEVIVKVVHH